MACRWYENATSVACSSTETHDQAPAGGREAVDVLVAAVEQVRDAAEQLEAAREPDRRRQRGNGAARVGPDPRAEVRPEVAQGAALMPEQQRGHPGPRDLPPEGA